MPGIPWESSVAWHLDQTRSNLKQTCMASETNLLGPEANLRDTTSKSASPLKQTCSYLKQACIIPEATLLHTTSNPAHRLKQTVLLGKQPCFTSQADRVYPQSNLFARRRHQIYLQFARFTPVITLVADRNEVSCGLLCQLVRHLLVFHPCHSHWMKSPSMKNVRAVRSPNENVSSPSSKSCAVIRYRAIPPPRRERIFSTQDSFPPLRRSSGKS